MQEQGRVITVHDGVVDVLMQVSSKCGGCSVCSRGSSGETVMREVTDVMGATVGDTVDVVIPDSIRPKAAAAVFLVPVACMILGYLAGFLLGTWTNLDPDTAGVVGALLSANIALFGVRLAERRLAGDAAFTPRVSAIISRGRDRN